MQDELTKEQELQLNEWLDVSAANRETYERISRLYREGLADYPLYAAAREDKAWAKVRGRMGKGRARVLTLKSWAAAAAVVLVVAGGGWWYLSGRSRGVVYATTAGEQQSVSLPDGSTVVLGPQSHIELAKGYDKTSRRIELTRGSARFEVVHRADQPFEVDMDAATVRDIGTSFTIDKTADSIVVYVSGGRIAFIQKENRKSTEISAGGAICLYTGSRRAEGIRETAAGGADSLRFEDTPLSLILTGLEKRTGKRIMLVDSAVAQKRLTVNLEGEAFENALEVICSSAGLKYTIRDGTYVLEKKD
ncbi:MAG TPA: FecR domain-containing protein [Puia sp.]|nr:FecR domain-containing protein [Puia sp.]